MRELGMSMIGESDIVPTEQLKMIKSAGFDCFFMHYGGYENIDRIAGAAADIGLKFESVHAPYSDINALWKDSAEGDEYLRFLLTRIIDGCARVHVDLCIIHTSIGNTAPPVSGTGIDRFRKMSDYARNKNIRLAFENLEPLPHFHAVMEAITEYHGFCWDCGHNLCYTPQMDMMAKYGGRILYTHIHDNYGVTRPGNIDCRDDLHLLPFEGALDWNWFADKIRSSGYRGSLTIEGKLKSKEEYRNMPLDEYFCHAFERAVKLRGMCDDGAGAGAGFQREANSIMHT